MDKALQLLAVKSRAFWRSRKANVAMMFGIALVPIMIAAGAGLDMARGMMARSAMSEALDAAALAVGSTPNVTQSQAQVIAQKYFNANYHGDPTYGSNPVLGAPTIDGQSVTLSVSQQVNTTLLAVGGIPHLNISASSTVVWGQTKLWVALVLDNTGSMTQTDSTGTSKISALKTASQQLLAILENASSNVGDVQASITPFAKVVNIGTGFANSTAIDWTDWEAQPPGGAPSTSVGPGSSCPWSTGSNGFRCVQSPSSSSTTSTVPSSGTYKGYICPSVISTYTASGSLAGKGGHYINGCYNSVPTQTLTTTKVTTTPTTTKQNCSQAGSGTITCTNKSGYPQTGTATSNTTNVTTAGYTGDSGPTTTNSSSGNTSDGSKSCSTSHGVTTCTWTRTITSNAIATTVTATGAAPFNHTWLVNDHSTWAGCIEDRAQDYDTEDTSPDPASAGTLFPATNDDNCPATVITPLPATWSNNQWTTLSNQITAMSANGSTNQTIGLAHGWQTLTSGVGPYDPPALPSNTTRYMILLSDGLNTQDRWNGDGSDQSSGVDTRMADACANAKADGIIIYTIFVDLGGTQGNSTVLQNCASDSSKYYDLTTSGAIVTAFNTIGQQITALRVSR